MSTILRNAQSELETLKAEYKPLLIAAIILLNIYCLMLAIQPGWVTYALGVPPLLILAITALARGHDIGRDKVQRRWQIRRLGFVFVGTASVGLLLMPFAKHDFPSWMELVIRWGMAFCWLTTPNQEPWWKYITRGDTQAQVEP